MTKDEALTMAIEKLEEMRDWSGNRSIDPTINACKEALQQEASEFFERGKEIAKWADEQNKQEPVAWLKDIDNAPIQIRDFADPDEEGAYPVYIHPAKRLSEDVKTRIKHSLCGGPNSIQSRVYFDGEEISKLKMPHKQLSDDDIDELLLQNPATHREFARAIEKKVRGE